MVLTRDPWIRALVIVALMIAGLYLIGMVVQALSQFSDILLLFFLAWVIAFILEPIVGFLRAFFRLPKAVAVTVAYLGALVMLTSGIFLVVPPLSNQVVQVLSVDLPAYADVLNSQALILQGHLDERGVNVNLATMLNYEDLLRRVEAMAPPIVSNAVVLATRVGTFFIQLAVVLMLSFYIMLDGDRITHGLLRVLPGYLREDAVFFFASVNRAFAGFLRGQLLQALVFTLGVALVMYAFGLELILLTSVVSTVLMLIPFVGPPLALIMPLVIAWAERPESFLPVLILINIHQQIVLNVVAPRVMSSAVGLHPLLVFVGILGGARVAGIWGALFGVPVVAVIAAMIQFYHAMIEQKRRAALAVGIDPDADPDEAVVALPPADVRRGRFGRAVSE
ncbi:MAG: AI-2E family transporter [Chloroflexota bacterium]